MATHAVVHVLQDVLDANRDVIKTAPTDVLTTV